MSDEESNKLSEFLGRSNSVDEICDATSYFLTRRGDIVRWLRRATFISADDLQAYGISRRLLSRTENNNASIETTLKVLRTIRELSPLSNFEAPSAGTTSHISELANKGVDTVKVDRDVFLSFDVANDKPNGTVELTVWNETKPCAVFNVRKRNGRFPTPYAVIDFILKHFDIPAPKTRRAFHQINQYL